LPSNSSMDLYPDNKVSQWKTKLSEFVELEDKWEVGLLEVSFPGTVYNVYARRYYLIVGGLSENWTIVLDNGTYNTIYSIIGEIQRSIVTLAAKKIFRLKYSSSRSDTLIVSNASEFSSPRMLLMISWSTSASIWHRCSASRQISTTITTRRMLTRFMPNDRCSCPPVPPTSTCIAIYSNT